jgi:hypothetical protein
MGGVQMMLVLGATLLLSLLVLNVNRSVLSSAGQTSQAEYTLAATSVGQTLINEIASKAFDAATVADPMADSTKFTSPYGLGRGSWEIYPDFNDVDDYHRFSTTISTPRAGDFTLRCNVHYVRPQAPDQRVNVRTRSKRVEVIVSHPLMQDDVRLYYYRSH